MVFVPRRTPIELTVDESRVEEIGDARERYVRHLVEETATADAHLDAVYRLAMESLVLDPECTWIWAWDAWAFAFQYHHAVVALGTSPRGSALELFVDYESRSLVSPGAMAGADARTWLTAFFMGLICRDEKRVRHLAGIPIERLRGEGKTGHPEYVYAWVSALQALINLDDRLVAHLREAMEASDAHSREATGSALESDLRFFPQLDLLRAYLTGEPDDFERTLVRGLEMFGDFHVRSQGTDPLEQVLPLGLLGLASLVYDEVGRDPGARMDVRSDYLPRVLLEGGRYGECQV